MLSSLETSCAVFEHFCELLSVGYRNDFVFMTVDDENVGVDLRCPHLGLKNIAAETANIRAVARGRQNDLHRS